MRKFIAILLLSVYLFSFQEFRQVLKFPLLIEQFVKHEVVSNDYTLLGFIQHHYFNKIKDSDYQQDMKLPFKTYDFSSVSTSLVMIFHEIENYLPEKPKNLLIAKNSNFFYQQGFISEYHFSVFQPPEI